jgi:hypothetical protein
MQVLTTDGHTWYVPLTRLHITASGKLYFGVKSKGNNHLMLVEEILSYESSN